MNTLSPPSAGRSSRSSSPSDMSSSASPYQYTQLATSPYYFGSPIDPTRPYLEMLDEPQEKFRFRYRSEMTGTHGCLLADGSEKDRKKYPTVRLNNYRGNACVRVTLCTAEGHLHPHQLEQKPVTDKDGNPVDCPIEMVVNESNDYTAIFQGMCVIHTPRKRQMKDEFEAKLRQYRLERKQWNAPGSPQAKLTLQETDEVHQDADKIIKEADVNNRVHLMFEAFSDESGSRVSLCKPLFSRAVFNLKSVQTSELKIVYLSRTTGKCTGDDEICILVEKVNKKDIKVRFFEEENGEEVWQAEGNFTQLGVHHQYAIVFRTPPYHDRNLTVEKAVLMQLYRPSDKATSEGKEFRYLPGDPPRKRPHLAKGQCQPRDSDLPPPKIVKQGLSIPGPSPVTTFISTGPAVPPAPITSSFSETSAPPAGPNTMLGQPMDFNLGMLAGTLPNLDPGTAQPFQWTRDPNVGNSPTHFQFMKETYPTIDFSELCQNTPIQYQSQYQVPQQQQPEDQHLSIDDIDPSINPFPEYGTMLNEMSSPQYLQIDAATGGTKKKTKSKKPPQDDDQVLSRGDDLGNMMGRLTIGDGNGNASVPDGRDLAMSVAKSIAESLQAWAASNDIAVVWRRLRHLFALQTEEGENALHTAVLYQQEGPLMDILRVLRQYHDQESINAVNIHDQTPLHLAVKGNQAKMVKELLEAGANPGIVDENGNTAFHVAVRMNHSQCLDELLKKKSYTNGKITQPQIINLTNHDPGSSPLHMAVRNGKLDLVHKLSSAGANADEPDRSQGNTSLHIAVEKENEDMVNYLLERTKAKINAQNYSGNTPLHVACDLKNKGLCLLLMSYGADPNMENYIKRNDESEEEEDKETDNNVKCHTAFDIAGDDETLLRILRGEIRLEKEAAAEAQEIACEASSKSEPQGLDSGIDIQSREMLSQSVDILDSTIRQEIAKILDRSPKLWRELAHALELGFLMHFIETQSSPATCILNNLDVNGVSLDKLISALEELNVTEAVDIINNAFTH